MIKLIYDSKTGHCKKICELISSDAIDIKTVDALDKNDKVILFTHTEGKGITPNNTLEFMKRYSKQVIGYVISGNYVKHPFEYGWAGLNLYKEFGHPIIRLVQQEGTTEDIEHIKGYIENLQNFDF